MTADVTQPPARLAVSVIVPVRDAESTLQATLDGLQAQQHAPTFEVIVVDNGSNDGSAELAERHDLGPRVLRRRRGEGAGAARNEGVAASSGEVIAFIDGDCEPTPDWIAKGARAIEGHDLVAGAVTPRPGDALGPFDRTLWVTRETGLYETANLFVRREWFDRLSGFEDWLPEGRGAKGAELRPFGEDVWFAWRARRLGARATFAADVLVHHAVFPRGPREYVAEQWRLRHFPRLVKRVPELRKTFAWGRYFLTSRSAAFDLGVAGLIAAAAATSPWPLVAVAPYAVTVMNDLRRSTRVALARTSRDVVGFAALVVGSIRARSPLL